MKELKKDEQSIYINAMRTDNYAETYITDVTFIEMFDKYVELYPKKFKIINKTDFGKTYRFSKDLLFKGLKGDTDVQ